MRLRLSVRRPRPAGHAPPAPIASGILKVSRPTGADWTSLSEQLVGHLRAQLTQPLSLGPDARFSVPTEQPVCRPVHMTVAIRSAGQGAEYFVLCRFRGSRRIEYTVRRAIV
jgi:hypothetical protein